MSDDTFVDENLGSVDRESVLRYAKRLFSDGNWIRFPRHLLWIMPANEAIVTAFLLNLYTATANSKHAKRRKGWVYCRIREMERLLQIKRAKQTRILKRLENMGILHRKRMGIPSRRYFKIDIECIITLICKAIKEKGNG